MFLVISDFFEHLLHFFWIFYNWTHGFKLRDAVLKIFEKKNLEHII